MKIAILIRGISHGKGKADFRKCVTNIRENLINPLKVNHEVKTYICTYDHPYIEEMRHLYSPEKIDIIPFEGSNQLSTFVKSLEMLKDEDVDFIFVTRFDLNYKHKITEVGKLDYDKVNFLYPPHDPLYMHLEFVSDLAIFLSKKHINEMIEATNYLSKNQPRPGLIDMHGIYKSLKLFLSEDQIHFMYDSHLKMGIELIR